MPKQDKYNLEEIAIGAVYQQLRKSKGYTLGEAAGEEISIPHLSNFENGHTIVATHHFFQLLDNINVNLYEFQNAYNLYLRPRDPLLFNSVIKDAILTKDIGKLFFLEHRLSNDASTSNFSRKNKLDLIRVKAAIFNIDRSRTVSKSDISYVKYYLTGLREWQIYDIELFDSCIAFFDPVMIERITKQMILPTQYNQNLSFLTIKRSECMINVINYFISREQYHISEQFLNYLDNLDLQDTDISGKLLTIHTRAKLHYLQGNSEAKSIMEKCLEILMFCNCPTLAASLINQHDQLF